MTMGYLLCVLLLTMLQISTLRAGVAVERRNDDTDSCPPIPHDCDPKCIKYDVPHCRKCECQMDPGSTSSGGPFSMTGPGSSPFDMGGMGSGSGGSSPFDMSGGSGAKSGPFDRGQNLYQTPYSSSMMSIGTGPSMFQPISRLGIQGAPSNNWPGIFMRPGVLQGQQICIKGKLVCPEYCLITDEYGCKTCPCGPANGMLPSVVGGTHIISRPHISTTKPPQTQKSTNGQCLATYVCMLSCKDGYKLGPKGSSGCQTCECTKNKEGKGSSNVNGTGNNTNGQSNNNQSKGQSNGQTGSGQSNGQNQGQSGSGGGQNGNNSQGTGQGTSTSQGNGFEMMGLSNSGSSGGSSTGSSENKFNPFFAGSLMVGSGGSGAGMGGGGGMSFGGSGGSGGGGCVGPFCAGSGSSGGGGGGAGPMLSPFAAASSGAGGPSGMTGMSNSGSSAASGSSGTYSGGSGSSGTFSGGSGSSGTFSGGIGSSSSGSGGGSGSQGPFGMSGHSGTELTQGNGNTMTTSTGSKQHTNSIASIPGVDCIGPACSAKNGHGNTMTANTGSKQHTIGVASIPGSDCIGPACSAKNGYGKPMTTNTGSKQQAVVVTSNGNPMATNTGSKQQTDVVASIPGLDCVGPACSAKNGHEVSKDGLAQLFEAAGLTDSKQTKYERHGNLKESMIRLFEAAGLTSSKYTDYERQKLMAEIMGIMSQKTATTRPTTCPETELCKRTCKYTVKLGNIGSDGCQVCSCEIKAPNPSTASVHTTNIYSVLQNCPEAVHCMTHCHDKGYTLVTKDNNGCPVCKCNEGVVKLVQCNAELTCPYWCSVGYKCDVNGCPICECVTAKEIGIQKTKPTQIQSSIVCNGQFSCIEKCELGYQSGSNGCPTCTCLHAGTETNTGIYVNHNGASTSGFQPTISSSNIGAGSSGACISGKCYTGTNHQLTMKEMCPQTYSCLVRCPYSYSLHTQEGSICPACTCEQPQQINSIGVNQGTITHVGPVSGGFVPPEKNQNQTNNIHVTAGNIGTQTLQTSCPGVYSCIKLCPNSYQLTNQNGQLCPQCLCAKLIHGNTTSTSIKGGNSHTSNNGGLLPSGFNYSPEVLLNHHNNQLNNHNHMSPGNIGHISSVVGGNTGATIVGGGSTSWGNLNLVGNVHHGKVEMRPLSPSQCADIIHCVMTCHHGYKVGKVGADGCPSCQCLIKT